MIPDCPCDPSGFSNTNLLENIIVCGRDVVGGRWLDNGVLEDTCPLLPRPLVATSHHSVLARHLPWTQTNYLHDLITFSCGTYKLFLTMCVIATRQTTVLLSHGRRDVDDDDDIADADDCLSDITVLPNQGPGCWGLPPYKSAGAELMPLEPEKEGGQESDDLIRRRQEGNDFTRLSE